MFSEFPGSGVHTVVMGPNFNTPGQFTCGAYIVIFSSTQILGLLYYPLVGFCRPSGCSSLPTNSWMWSCTTWNHTGTQIKKSVVNSGQLTYRGIVLL